MDFVEFISLRNIGIIRWENPDVITREEFLKILPFQQKGLLDIDKIINILGEEKSKKIFNIIQCSIEHQVILHADVIYGGFNKTIFIFLNENKTSGSFIASEIKFQR